MTNTADAIIIGGGIHGASLAFHLGERGMKSIVLEKNTLASGATGRSSGVVRMHYDLEPESRLAWASFPYFRNWEERIGGRCDFTRAGFIHIAKRSYEEQLRKNIAMHQRIGIPSLLITADDAKRLAPNIEVDDFDIAGYEPESGYADPSASAASLMDAAKRLGARLIQGVSVTGIQLVSGKVRGVRTSAGDFSAPIVVNAAGAWAQSVAKMAGVALPIDTWRHDVAFVHPPAGIAQYSPVVFDSPNSMYIRPETGGLILIGLEDDNPLGESPDGYTDRAQPGFVERAVDRICTRIPKMEAASLHSDQGGYDGLSPDQRAILGQIGPEGFYAQCGFSGTGFKIAPAVGLCMSELIIDGKAKTVDITPFDPNRFERGELLEPEHAYEDVWH
ncbi:MAG: FAD-binding oxidoreductase [Anaerolineae bacterium]|jgi:sarcosine oxidase, subunit beta|nr:FAD-binding oxidoreductase [Anaerolineae bacterium]MBT7075223.1 FAD-binding oxidoreductase [Anaerolineae bacterium]MBT7781836.1 FAD-binding oxidoreductase [Anaerolineae bacterium]